MNTGRLKELLELVDSAERLADTQSALQDLSNSLSNVVSQPQNPDLQTSLARAHSNFKDAVEKFQSAFAPREFELALALNEDAFKPDLVEEISDMIVENAMSPNVVKDFVDETLEHRQQVFENIESLSKAFEFFNVSYGAVDEGHAELGFQIPREFFDNDLDGLINEMSQLRNMLRFFSEATIGKYEPAKIGAISTTDPLIFLAMIEPLAVKVGALVQWALTVWIGVETIRNLRAETEKSKAFSEEEIENFYGSKIKADIDKKVDAKVQEMLEQGKAEKSREGELKVHLDWALRALLAKVERGMTVELRIAPPPLIDTAEEEDEEQDVASSANYNDLKNIQSQLVFPQASGTPVLELPKENDEDDED